MKSEVENNEKVLYTDGSAVTVTESVLQVKKTWYDLKGITKYGFAILQPARVPWMVVLAAGITLLIMGSMKLVPSTWIGEVYLDDVIVTGNLVAAVVGSLIALASIGVILSMSERYAVSITTADGEHNVVVSKSKEYVSCIVHALNSAFFARIQSKGEGKVRQYTVSGR